MAGAAALALMLGMGWAKDALASPRGAAPVLPVSEVGLWGQELREGGLLRFYEATEAELRVGKFESAALRYRFLKGQLLDKPAYQPLGDLVEQRLKLLAVLMGLRGGEMTPLVPGRGSRSPNKARAAKKDTGALGPENPKGAGCKEKEERTGEEPPGKHPSGSPTAPLPQAASAEKSRDIGAPAESSSHPETSRSSGGEDGRMGNRAAESPPAPSLSRWQRLKRRLQFWRQ